MSDIRKIAVLTSGGDAPGMNSAVRAVVVSAINSGIEIVGVMRGYEDLSTGRHSRSAWRTSGT